MSRSLTAKQQKFVEEICKGASPSQAYILLTIRKTQAKKQLPLKLKNY